MILRTERKLRRRRLIVLDNRGLPARQMDIQHVNRRYRLLLHWAEKNGISVITDAGQPEIVVLGVRANAALLERLEAIKATEATRRRNPGGVFDLADEVFGARWRADQWMQERIVVLGDRRPIDLLVTAEDVEEVVALLNRILHGFYS